LNPETFTLDYWAEYDPAKQLTVMLCALNHETRLEQIQLAGALEKKWGDVLFLATRDWLSGSLIIL
jgi:hypothetical protein